MAHLVVGWELGHGMGHIMPLRMHIRTISPTTDLDMNIQSGDQTISGITVKGIWSDWHQTAGRG